MKKFIFSLWLCCLVIAPVAALAGYLSYDAKYFGYQRLTIPTYDSGDEPMHPSIVDMGTAWNGYRYWMAFTPYTGSSATVENPSIVASNDRITWVVPGGLTNPIDADPAGDPHNLDTFLYYKSDSDELWCFYIDNVAALTGKNNVRLRKSSDGVTWGAEIDFINHIASGVSASFIEVAADDWRVYYTDQGVLKYRKSADSGSTWAAAVTCTVNGLTGWYPWHGEIRKVGSNYNVLMYSCKSGASVSVGQINAGRSTDGATFTFDSTPLITGYTYKVAWIDDGSTIDFYWSGLGQIINGTSYQWSTWYTPSVPSPFAGYIANTQSFNHGFELNNISPFYQAFKSGGTVSASSTVAHSGTYSLKLTTSSTSGNSDEFCTYLPASMAGKTVTWWMYDDNDSSAIKQGRLRSINYTDGTFKRVGLGVWTGTSTTKYVYQNEAATYTATSVSRKVNDWVKFGYAIAANGLSADLYADGVNVATLTLTQQPEALCFWTYANAAGTTTYYIDDIQVEVADPPATNSTPFSLGFDFSW